MGCNLPPNQKSTFEMDFTGAKIRIWGARNQKMRSLNSSPENFFKIGNFIKNRIISISLFGKRCSQPSSDCQDWIRVNGFGKFCFYIDLDINEYDPTDQASSFSTCPQRIFEKREFCWKSKLCYFEKDSLKLRQTATMKWEQIEHSVFFFYWTKTDKLEFTDFWFVIIPVKIDGNLLYMKLFCHLIHSVLVHY